MVPRHRGIRLNALDTRHREVAVPAATSPCLAEQNPVAACALGRCEISAGEVVPAGDVVVVFRPGTDVEDCFHSVRNLSPWVTNMTGTYSSLNRRVIRSAWVT